MSANNQILIKEHKGKWYVFEVMAESWSEKNELSTKDAQAISKTLEGAYIEANRINKSDWTEYGIAENLIKDGADVTLTD